MRAGYDNFSATYTSLGRLQEATGRRFDDSHPDYETNRLFDLGRFDGEGRGSKLNNREDACIGSEIEEADVIAGIEFTQYFTYKQLEKYMYEEEGYWHLRPGVPCKSDWALRSTPRSRPAAPEQTRPKDARAFPTP